MSVSESFTGRAAVRPKSVLSRDSGAMICERCEIADRPLSRLRGLLGRRSLAPGAGLMLMPSDSIHTCFMRFPIDAVFLDAELRVLRVRDRVAPWRVAGMRRARAVLELAEGEAERCRLEVGEQLYLTPVPIAMTGAASAATVSKEA
jgi:uncharacterized protein